MINPSIFKAYDIRGVYPGEVDKDSAYRIGQAYVSFTNASSVVVGQDMRSSSPELFGALVEGVTEAGAQVIDVGLVATPEFYFAVAHSEYDGGVMVTASHNPAKYNGFKLVRSDASPIGEVSGLDEIKKIALRGEKIKKPKGNILESDILDEYLDKVFSIIAPESLSNFQQLISSIKIVVDTGNGMAGVIQPELWKRLKKKITKMFFTLDGAFPNHEADPSKAKNLIMLGETVRQVGADIGIAFDGDGDRVGFVDETGSQIRNDLIFALMAEELLRQNQGALVLSALGSSRIIEEEVSRLGGKHQTARVGHAFIKNQMRAAKAVAAAETSGHFYFKDFYGVECSDLAMLYVLKIMSNRKARLSEIIKPLRKYHHSGEINFEIADKEKIMKKLEKQFTAIASSILKIDGLRFEFNDPETQEFLWWFNVRPSNTEPLLRLNVEATNKELLDEKLALLTKAIKSG